MFGDGRGLQGRILNLERSRLVFARRRRVSTGGMDPIDLLEAQGGAAIDEFEPGHATVALAVLTLGRIRGRGRGRVLLAVDRAVEVLPRVDLEARGRADEVVVPGQEHLGRRHVAVVRGLTSPASASY